MHNIHNNIHNDMHNMIIILGIIIRHNDKIIIIGMIIMHDMHNMVIILSIIIRHNHMIDCIDYIYKAYDPIILCTDIIFIIFLRLRFIRVV